MLINIEMTSLGLLVTEFY